MTNETRPGFPTERWSWPEAASCTKRPSRSSRVRGMKPLIWTASDVRNTTRLAVSPAGRHLAFVAEP